MNRVLVTACALGLWAVPAGAQGLKLRPPDLTAQQQQSCSPQQRAMCQGVGDQRALQHDLACDACGEVARMPAEMVAPPASSSRPTPPLECAMREMPLGPNPPGCQAPPLDAVPVP
jgi:hypothetical protein